MISCIYSQRNFVYITNVLFFFKLNFYVIANYSKAANIMNYFKFIKHNKNVVSRKILINIKSRTYYYPGFLYLYYAVSGQRNLGGKVSKPTLSATLSMDCRPGRTNIFDVP